MHCAPGSLALCPCKDKCQHTGVKSDEESSPGLGMQQEKPTDKPGKRQQVTGVLEAAGHRGRARLRVLRGCENLDLRGHMVLSTLAQVTEPLRGSCKDSCLADDICVPCQ